MSKKKNARELALKILFQIDVGKIPLDEVLESSFEEVNPPDEFRGTVEEMVRGVAAELEELDRTLGALAKGWSVDRMPNVDKNVLRLALWELKNLPKSPHHLVINDAVELAKKYSTEESGRFVNGVLGGFLRSRQELA
jgi:N utilization substance protein B